MGYEMTPEAAEIASSPLSGACKDVFNDNDKVEALGRISFFDQ
jgi:hypothetical protein